MSKIINRDAFNAALAALEAGRLTTPYHFLGVHKIRGGWQLRVWLPYALRVTAHSGKQNAGRLVRRSASGLFTRNFATHPGLVHLEVDTPQGSYHCMDPYQFSELAIRVPDLHQQAPNALYRAAGAQLIKHDDVSGCRFMLYAPNASAVALIGELNWWDPQCHPMHRLNNGYWTLFVPGIGAGHKYKYRLQDAQGHVLPDKADPLGFHAEQYPSHASLVYDHNAYQWQDNDYRRQTTEDPYSRPISIYEVHLGSWRRDEQGESLDYRTLARELVAYASEQGFTHLELLPVSEHPFDGSWGYQPVGLFAPTSRFGDPDGFKFLVDCAHQAGLGVILDWVPAHFPEDSHGLARFDGTCLYEYADPRKGWHPDWQSCIYDYGREHVRQFLVANALYWFEHFHIDGLRVDAVASMLYLDYSRNDGEWIPNVDGGNHNYEAISLLKWMNSEVYRQFPYAITIAEESTSFARVSAPVHEGGLGFGFKWNMGWMHDSLHFMSKDPAYRPYHHNEMTFSMVYAYDENFVLPLSHDEVVHGKGSLIRKMPGDEWQQAANLRAYMGFMFGHPGKKLNFMGNELGQSAEWNHMGQLEWHHLQYDKHQGVQRLLRRLNQLYRTEPALHQLDHDQAGFAWLCHQDAQASVLGFIRHGKDPAAAVVVVCNFTPTPHSEYCLGVPEEGEYEVIFNSDDRTFWGSGYELPPRLVTHSEPSHGHPQHLRLILPPLATLFLRRCR